jgi:hypothetical protein
MIKLNGKEVGVEVVQRYSGKSEVNLVAKEGTYELAEFSRHEDATAFVALIKEQGREYTTEDYKVK